MRQFVIRRPLPPKEGKKQQYKAPKIQRLITPVRLQRKRHLLALKRKWGEWAGVGVGLKAGGLQFENTDGPNVCCTAIPSSSELIRVIEWLFLVCSPLSRTL